MENDDLSVAIDPRIPQDFFKAGGMNGMGIAPTTLTITDSIGGGGRWRSTRRGVRQANFPIHVFGTDRADILRKLQTLVRVLNDRFSTPKLVASLPNGQVYEIEMHYSSGFDYTWGSETDGRHFVKLPLVLVFPDPYWTARWSNTLRLQSSSGRGLLKHPGSLSALRISGSSALGELQIVNTGDVDAYPLWKLTGPGASFTAVREVDGATMQYTQSIAAGQSIYINCATKEVYDASGSNLYGGMGPAPKFFGLPPGSSTIAVLLEGATSQSVAQMQYKEKRELLF